MYKVIKAFTDLYDEGHVYHEGDEFPRSGAKVSDDRIAKLASEANRQGIPLIVETVTPVSNKPAVPVQEETSGQEPHPAGDEQKEAPKKKGRKKKES